MISTEVVSIQPQKQWPCFAVVGHPNKGKSSIVSTLANDPRVAISNIPGTTTVSQSYPMSVDGKTLYELIDTPGFQRAHEVLAWLNEKLQQNEWAAHQRHKAIEAFINDVDCQNKYPDEYQLLNPLMAGAGILYVVDGSRPYGREYEAEMEILRWTGCPSMALINKIHAQDFSKQWQHALDQYFKIVRQFNPMDIEWKERISLLRAFGEIHRPWFNALDSAVKHLEQMRDAQAKQSANIITKALLDMMLMTMKKRLPNSDSFNFDKQDEDNSQLSDALHSKYLDAIRGIESTMHRSLLNLYLHGDLDANMEAINGLDLDLFSEKSWSIFGLNQKELMMTGMAGGAAVGGVMDVAVGGTSLFAGAGIGALLGAASVWFSQDKIAKVKVMGIPFGAKHLRIGPVKNPNFPYVVLTRALVLHDIILDRTHANKKAIDRSNLDDNSDTASHRIEEPDRKKLARLLAKLNKGQDRDSAIEAEISNTIQQAMHQ